MRNNKKTDNRPLLIVGEGQEAYSIAGNVLNAGQQPILLTADRDGAHAFLTKICPTAIHRLTLLKEWPETIPCALAIAFTRDDLELKKEVIQKLASHLPADVGIAINTESIPLDQLQEAIGQPERIMGLNWSYPAHLTLFLEIITNVLTDPELVSDLETMARTKWGKDPYILQNGFSTRARMMAAWAREAVYLVENGYASMESIDRACRNDPGYYLPFSGNFRYMDLMGTYAYGMVMKDLNPDLAKTRSVSSNLVNDLRNYLPSNRELDDDLLLHFGKEIRRLILKYSHEKIDS